MTRLSDDDVMAIAARLRELRLAYGFAKVVRWAEEVGLGETAIHNYEKGQRMISVPEAIKFSAATGVTFDWIYRGYEHTLPSHVREKLAAYRAEHKKKQHWG